MILKKEDICDICEKWHEKPKQSKQRDPKHSTETSQIAEFPHEQLSPSIFSDAFTTIHVKDLMSAFVRGAIAVSHENHWSFVAQN